MKQLAALVIPFLIVGVGASYGAEAKAQANDDVQYTVDFFWRFRPQSAWDIVIQTPGFTVEEVGEARGFQGNAGNVLIDGKRPLAKGANLEDVLRRIPATEVAYVELIYGAQAASDVGARNVVLNVVTKGGSASSTYRIEWSMNSRYRQGGAAELGTARKFGAWGVKARAEIEAVRLDYDSYERTYLGPSGDLTLFEVEDPPDDRDQVSANLEAQRDFASGASLAVSGVLEHRERFRQRLRDRYPTLDTSGPPNSMQDLRTQTDQTLVELTAEWDQPLSQRWSLRNLLFASLSDEDENQTSQVSSSSDILSNRSFTGDFLREEYIWRFAVNNSSDGVSAFDVGGELSVNTLESETVLLSGSSTMEMTEGLSVEEIRFEPFARLNFNLPGDILFEGGLSGEFVDISVRGDASTDNDASYVLPSIVLKKQFGTADTGNLVGVRISRDVSQLSFGDFVASAKFGDEQEFAGNQDLLPDDRWRYAVFSELRTKQGRALSVEAFFEDITNPLEQVAFEDGGFGIANVGDAERWGASAKLSWPLERLLPGGLLVAELEWQDSRVDDPQTGETRTLNFNLPLKSSLDFRQDLSSGRLSWGASVQFAEDQDLYFADADNPFFRGENIGAFLELTVTSRMRAKFSLDRIGGQQNGDDLLWFEPDRSGAFVGSRISRRQRSTVGSIALSGQF